MSHHKILLADLMTQKIGIFGYGLEGKATLTFLREHGVPLSHITIIDGNTDLTPPYAEVSMLLGKTVPQDLEHLDVIFRSAGVSPRLPCFEGHGHKITTQTQFFFDNYLGKTIVVTGTKGKSTTTSLIYETLKHAGTDAILVGNIGIPVLGAIERGHVYDRVVLELSSYQLENLEANIDIGVLINLYPEHHSDRHQGMDKYFQAKLNLLAQSQTHLIGSQVHKDFALEIQGYDNNHFFGEQGTYTYAQGMFAINGESVADDHNMILLGTHNRYNACAALGITDLLDIDQQAFQQAIDSYSGLPHRLQDIGIVKGIRRIDDAISTTPQSTMAAIETFGDDISTIFLGGKDGGYDFEQLTTCLRKHEIHNVVLFPDSGKHVKPLLDESFIIYETADMQQAVERAAQHTEKGKIALLSCASPSYSVWKNFEEKGDLFQQAIHSLQ